MFTLLLATRPPFPLSHPYTHLIVSPRGLIYTHTARRATALWSPRHGPRPRPRQLRGPPADPSCKNWTTPVRAPSHQGTARPAQRSAPLQPPSHALSSARFHTLSHALLLSLFAAFWETRQVGWSGTLRWDCSAQSPARVGLILTGDGACLQLTLHSSRPSHHFLCSAVLFPADCARTAVDRRPLEEVPSPTIPSIAQSASDLHPSHPTHTAPLVPPWRACVPVRPGAPVQRRRVA